MMKSLLIGLDISDESHSVLELGLRWAKRFDALAVGLGIVDEPGLLTTEAKLFETAYHRLETAYLVSNSRHQVERALRQIGRRCAEADVKCSALEDVGIPFVRILMEAQRRDIILLGQQSHFDYGRDDGPDETLSNVLRNSPRPVVVVPKTLREGESVVVAYDGSLQAARALYAFEASGLGGSRKVHVVSVAADNKEAARHADPAIEFLRLHAIEAIPHPVATSMATAEVILRKVHQLEAGLLVMGAYGQPVLREFFLGSVTRTVLKESPVPVFCSH
jgi:nucleotide-binding universal stress UspA family protein